MLEIRQLTFERCCHINFINAYVPNNSLCITFVAVKLNCDFVYSHIHIKIQFKIKVFLPVLKTCIVLFEFRLKAKLLYTVIFAHKTAL